MLNPIGNSKRGIGRSFQMSGQGGTKTFFERNVSMKDYDRLFGGQELSEQQLEELKMDPYSEPFILCIRCEKRMGIVEDYFNDNIYENIFAYDRLKNNISIQSENKNVIKLFFLSMIWRSSIARFDNFQIQTTIEQRLKHLLNNSIGDDIEETLKLSSAYEEEIEKEALFCATASVFCDITANQILIDNTTEPYFFEINEYSVCYFGSVDNPSVNEDLFGLEKYISDDSINQGNCQFKICIIENSDWNEKRNKIGQKKASEFVHSTKIDFYKKFVQVNKTKPTEAQVKAFIDDLIYGTETTVALRYSQERIDSLINKHT